jgi:DNA integrity scanning protein DisA with diadenylate cyclase activity
MTDKLKILEEELIRIGIKIAKRGEGALFVIGDVDHELLVEQSVLPFKVLDNPKLLESLALMDGAVIVDKNGVMKSYGAMIKTTKTLKNFGTRHSAAFSASTKGNIAILVSEEDKKIRIMKDEKVIMQIDALEKNVEQSVSSAVNILESVGAGAIGAIGTGILAPTLGLAMLPGIVIFGSAYYLTKLLANKFKNNN